MDIVPAHLTQGTKPGHPSSQTAQTHPQKNPLVCRVRLEKNRDVQFFQGADPKLIQAVLRGLA